MKPVRIYRGDTWERTWTIKDSTGTPINLTGATVRLQVRDSDDVLKVAYTDLDGLTVTPLAGKIELAVPYGDTELTPGTYSFDIEVTYPAGRRKTYEKNSLVIIEDVTHD